MPKRQTDWTEAKISRYIKEGRGQGELASYKPWLTIQDVPPHGRVHPASLDGKQRVSTIYFRI